jgi:hypothetical protein
VSDFEREMVACLNRFFEAEKRQGFAYRLKQSKWSAQYVDVLVPLGRERESMGTTAKAQAQSQLMTRLLGIERTDTFKRFQKLATVTYGPARTTTDAE